MSPELKKLAALRVPEEVRPGDMWHCSRLGIVWLFLGHKKGRRNPGHTMVSLYHWGKPSLLARPVDLRDFDANGGKAFDPLDDNRRLREKWEYIGNMFEMLPYTGLTGHIYERVIA